MATGGWCGLGPLRLFRKKAYGLETMRSSSYVLSKTHTKKPKLSKVVRSKKTSRCKDNYVQVMELRKKILILRDIIDLPSIERSVSINELVVGTMEDLHKLYPEIISDVQYSKMKPTCIEQSLFYFCTALQSIGDSWMLNHVWRDKSKYNFSPCQENLSFNEIVESVLAVIDCIVSMANERFDTMDEYVNSKNSYSRASSFRKSTSSAESSSETNSSCCSSPETPTSVLADFRNSQRKSTEKENASCSSPLLWSLRVKAVEKLNPIDIKHLLLPRLSHIEVNACPSKSGVAIIEESTMDVDDKPTSEKTDAADGNEEMEVIVTKEDIGLSRVHSQKAYRSEEMEVSDIKEDKLDLSREDSQKTDKNEEVEVSDIKEEELYMSREDGPKENRIEEIEVSDIKEEKLDLSTAESQKTNKIEEIEMSDIQEEKLILSRANSQKTDKNEVIEMSDIQEEKLDLSRADSQKTDRNEEVEVSDIKEEELDMSREDSQKENRIEEIEGSDIEEEKLDLSTAKSQKTNKIEEIEMSDIQDEKLNLSRADSQKTDKNQVIEMGDIQKEKFELSRADSQKIDKNEEIEISDIQEEKLDLSRADSQKTDKIEEVEMSDIKEEKLDLSKADKIEKNEISDTKEEKLDLSRADSQKETAETTNDIASQAAAATVEEFHAPELPNVASEPPPFAVVMQPAIPPAVPPPPSPPPMMHQNTVQAQQLSPPPPPLPQIEVQPTIAASMAPPPPPPPFKVIATVVHSMVNAGVPPPPPMSSLKGGAPPPPMPQGNGLTPPPPPGGAFQSLRSKKAATKLKRSNQLGTLYRTLKKKVEGSNQNLKGAHGRKGGGGNSAGGKQGMADALAEMTKRSAYFQQIEEDVRKHSKSITALKSSISSFKSTNMSELLAFHESVESVLEKLTDESQVLARFEGFPIKKLETLRTAVALYLKLDAMVVQLQNWKIVSPMKQLLDRVDSYFNKIKGEVDALERTKDEESKRFKSHGIEFDFSILIRIKESMVDISSNCMELALKEKSELKAAAEKSRNGAKSENLNKECSKMLWKVFQFAYRVYTFAGGHDERADRLTRELALEIESESHHL